MKIILQVVFFVVCVSLAACVPAKTESCKGPVKAEDAALAESLVREKISRLEGARSLRAVDATYETPTFSECGKRVAVRYDMKTVLADGSLMVGGNRLYYVLLSNGEIEEVYLGE